MRLEEKTVNSEISATYRVKELFQTKLTDFSE